MCSSGGFSFCYSICAFAQQAPLAIFLYALLQSTRVTAHHCNQLYLKRLIYFYIEIESWVPGYALCICASPFTLQVLNLMSVEYNIKVKSMYQYFAIHSLNSKISFQAAGPKSKYDFWSLLFLSMVLYCRIFINGLSLKKISLREA